MTEATEQPVESFEDAFSKLASLTDEAPAVAQAETASKPEETPAQPGTEAAAEPAAEGEVPAEEPAAPAEEPEKPVEEPKSASNPESEVILERLARMVREQPAEPPQVQPQMQPEPSLFSKEEQEVLSSYEKDWPEVARAESLRRRAEYRELVGYVFNEVAKELRPVVEMVHTMTQRTHLSDLKATVNDYDDVRDKVIGWVEQQPAYLQLAYKHVIEEGTVDEVADLIERYKRDSGASARSAAAPAPRKTESELPSATKQAAAALAPVSSKRSAVPQASDPDDFESAFAAFAGKL